MVFLFSFAEHCNHLDLPLKAVASRRDQPSTKLYCARLTPIFTFIAQYKTRLIIYFISIINSFALEFVVFFGGRARKKSERHTYTQSHDELRMTRNWSKRETNTQRN